MSEKAVFRDQKKYFISFADTRMSAAIARIAKQAEEMDFFDEIHVMDETSLEQDFSSRWRHIMRSGIRGFGYWCWKPYIILRLLERIPDDSVLLYCDAGCHLNPAGVNRLNDYINELNGDHLGIKAFPSSCSYAEVIERKWTKGDLFDYFGCRHQKKITDSIQVAATQILFRKNEKSVAFVREWYQIFCNHFYLVDDSRSKAPNLTGFIENRHDQSVFSLLYKSRGGSPLPSGETDASNPMRNMYPFWNMRDRGYKDTRFLSRFRRLINAYIHLTKVRIAKIKETMNK